MEQKVEIKSLQGLIDWINISNICYVSEKEDNYFLIEAPNNADVCVRYEDSEIDDIISKTIDQLEDFDADERFTELWSVEFANHNHFSPSQFITMLKEDEESFRVLARDLSRFL